VVGPFGLLQPLADGVKLMFKEVILPAQANKVLFLMAPIITFVLALIGWAVVPFSESFAVSNINVGVTYLLATSSLGVYGIIISGWASNSKYAFLGAIRSSAQMISYEVSIGLIIISVVLSAGSLNLSEIVLAQKNHWFVLPHFPMFILFFVSALAETNRLPFDLPEAESELVAGYNVEYSSMPFSMFFLGEYANMILISAFASILFLGGWLSPFEFLDFIPGPIWLIIKILVLLFCFIWVRATLPRYRYDQLMRLGWKVFLPISLIWVVATSACIVYLK
jgi:NADH-quinone oxidoreductase subunit H